MLQESKWLINTVGDTSELDNNIQRLLNKTIFEVKTMNLCSLAIYHTITMTKDRGCQKHPTVQKCFDFFLNVFEKSVILNMSRNKNKNIVKYFYNLE